MSIELTIKYSDSEYKSAIKEKLAVMPNINLHTYLPTGILILFGLVLFYFKVVFSWWGISLIVLTSIYAIPCLFGSILMPPIALAFAKKRKLQDTYHFTINEEQIERSSRQSTLRIKWEELTSVDFFPQNIFFNLKKGSMVIPNSRLTDSQLEELKLYAALT
ncbi:MULTISPECIES: YcxB family protein [unclassified Pseudoalteromonas]|uniref:YcxB family protein n=1 Tax=unclassified Pseudoalteromonas TaxID=194690 RepID=UPI00390C4165